MVYYLFLDPSLSEKKNAIYKLMEIYGNSKLFLVNYAWIN